MTSTARARRRCATPGPARRTRRRKPCHVDGSGDEERVHLGVGLGYFVGEVVERGTSSERGASFDHLTNKIAQPNTKTHALLICGNHRSIWHGFRRRARRAGRRTAVACAGFFDVNFDTTFVRILEVFLFLLVSGRHDEPTPPHPPPSGAAPSTTPSLAASDTVHILRRVLVAYI